MTAGRYLVYIRLWLALFMFLLILSGTALLAPFRTLDLLGVSFLTTIFPQGHSAWLLGLKKALIVAHEQYPYLVFLSDWLFFAHVAIAIAFIGPFRQPLRNRWVIDFGLIVCGLVIPATLIFGALRDIPWYWQVFDMTFGAGGVLLLMIVRRMVRRLEPDKG